MTLWMLRHGAVADDDSVLTLEAIMSRRLVHLWFFSSPPAYARRLKDMNIRFWGNTSDSFYVVSHQDFRV